jgi:hypothetical protein
LLRRDRGIGEGERDGTRERTATHDPMEETLNRRTNNRHPCTGVAEICQNGRRCGWGKIIDISCSGCYIETVYPLPIGTEVQLHLTIAGNSLEIGAQVVWITPQVGMGLSFLTTTAEEENTLAQITEEVTALHPFPLQQAEDAQLAGATIHVSREAATEILPKIISHINEKGVMTREELIDLVKAHQ